MKGKEFYLPIIGVALKHGDITMCLPKPFRHNDCFSALKQIGCFDVASKADNQGFYLEDGTFLNRKEAFEHAKNTGQIKNPEAKFALFSEDLW